MADNAWQEPTATTTAALDRITLRPDKAHEQRTSPLHPILDLPQRLAREQAHATAVANGRTSDPAIAPFDALATPVVHTDLFGIVTGWNRAAETLFGYSAREVIGRRLATIPPEEEERYAHFRQRVLIGETITNVAVEQIHKQGHRVSVLLSAAPWYADGEVVGVATSLTDLSAQKAREWELVALAGAEARRARDAVYITAVTDACVADDERAILDALVGCTAEWSDSAGVVMTGEGGGELVAYASAVRDADGPVAALFEACAMHW
ncbi:MAG: PAS domain S-box protein, partial [Chloroflexota bacterium]|nr:PAS domain S-box protein [Chloroflexota bacterium]